MFFFIFRGCIESISQFSPGAKIFCLVHKSDLIPQPERPRIFELVKTKLDGVVNHAFSSTGLKEIVYFHTSIWDETLFDAWSRIINSIIPNINLLENELNLLCSGMEATEVVLFEKATFLVIASSKSQEDLTDLDKHRFEKISNIIKQFKLSVK